MIYLDNCSTTLPRSEVIESMAKSFSEDFGNPSSLHRLGLNAEKKIKKARDIIGNFLDINRDEVYFTSGGTESNNIAIQSIINKMKNRGNHIITTKIEHASVLNTIKHYEKQGLIVTYLNVDRFGMISLDEFRNSIRQDTILVSIMHVNNEIGTIQPISEIKNILKERKSDALFHVDGIQGYGKVPINLREYGVDTYSFSSHKIYGPKGVGGLYINNKNKLSSIIYGGNQEKGIRSGTENSTGIIGFGEATRIISENFLEERKKAQELKEYLIKGLNENIEDISINTATDENASPYILNVSFNNVRGEVLLHYLEKEEIYVSTTSACSSKGKGKSYVLESIGLNDNQIEGTIRICFSHDTIIEDIEYTIDILKKSVNEIRKIMMR